MNTYILSNAKEIERLKEKNNKFADSIGSSLPFHRLQMPFLWWKHFASENNVDFGSKRGRNFLGYRSWLNNLSFIIVENKGSICGVAPLFISSVLLERGRNPIKLLSFCPDSVLVFYQDFLVNPFQREEIIANLFQCIESLVKAENLLVFLGHIPDNSRNLPYYRKEISLRQARGWFGGETTNCSRGGVYPWNIPQLSRVLQSALNEPAIDSRLESQIKELLELLKSQTSALMAFVNTRRNLEKSVQDIIRHCSAEPKKAKLSQAISDTIDTKPIVYPYLEVPKDIDSFYSSLSSSKRYYYRRYMKQFIRAGGAFENIPPSEITLSDVKEYLALHLQRWGKDSVAVNNKTIAFHEELSLHMAKCGYFRLFFAKHNAKRIAALSCFDIGKRREYFFSGRTLDDGRLRSGKLLVLHTILDAIERSIEIYDFGYGGDDYKFDFTKKSHNVKSFFLTNETGLPDLDKLFPGYEYIVV